LNSYSSSSCWKTFSFSYKVGSRAPANPIFAKVGFKVDSKNIPVEKWAKPELVCEIFFMINTPDLRLRHPRFKRLRNDKPATDSGFDQIAKLQNR